MRLVRRASQALVAAGLLACFRAPAQDSFDPSLLESAVASYSRALETGPDSAEMRVRRGSALLALGQVEQALEDFDRAAALDPSVDPHLWQRGIASFYAGRFREGRLQFERHQRVNPHDVENAAWHFLCAARELGIDRARQRMLTVSGDPRVPMAEIYELFRGRADAEGVLSAAAGGDPSRRREQLFYAHLYLGIYYDAIGDPRRAAEHLRQAVEEYSVGHYMWHVARLHLERLEARR